MIRNEPYYLLIFIHLGKSKMDNFYQEELLSPC